MIAVKHSRRKRFQMIRDRLTYGRRTPLQASRRQVGHGRSITWTLRGMPAAERVVEHWPGGSTVMAARHGQHMVINSPNG